jgi:hypothetical protein
MRVLQRRVHDVTARAAFVLKMELIDEAELEAADLAFALLEGEAQALVEIARELKAICELEGGRNAGRVGALGRR